MAVNNHSMRDNLVARVLIAANGESSRRLDYFGSPMAHPMYRITDYITTFETLIVTDEYKYSPELLAADRYGYEELFWVILKFSGIVNALDPVMGFIPGRMVRIPDPVEVNRWLQDVNADNLSKITYGEKGNTTLVTI